MRTVHPFALRFMLLAAPALPCAVLPAQEARPVAVGATVRVLAGPVSTWRQGQLVALEGLQVLVAPAGAVDTILFSEVRRFEVRREMSASSKFGLGFLGLLFGAAIGGAIGYHATQDCNCDSPGSGVYLGVPLGGLFGLVGGAVLGGISRWVPAPLPAVAR